MLFLRKNLIYGQCTDAVEIKMMYQRNFFLCLVFNKLFIIEIAVALTWVCKIWKTRN